MPRKRKLQSYWEDRLVLDAENLAIEPLFETLAHRKFSAHKLHRVAYDVMNDDGVKKKINPRRKAVLNALLGALKAQDNLAELAWSLNNLLQSAIIERDSAMVRFILSWGAKPDAPTMKFALEFPQNLPRELKILEMLLKAGGKITDVELKVWLWTGLNRFSTRKINKMTPRQVVEHIRARMLAHELEEN